MVDEESTSKPGYSPKYWTPKTIEKIRPRERVFEVADPQTPGLILRVEPTGKKTFRWYVRSLGRVITIGPWAFSETPSHVTLKEARDYLHALKMARTAGLDRLDAVATDIKAAMAPKLAASAASRGDMVEVIAERWLKTLNGRRKRPEEARAIMEKDILPVIGALPLRSIKKSDCRAVVSKVMDRGAKVYAGRVLGLLKQFLAYADNVEDDFVSPATNLKASNFGVENNVRNRWLTQDEIPVFWKALELESTAAPETREERRVLKAALRLLLLTGVRSGELRLAAWDEVDIKQHQWVIPVANQKLTLAQQRQAKPFIIPLPPTAVTLFEELRELAGESRWVLASKESHDGRYSPKALSKAMYRLWRKHADLQKLSPAVPHDLRRTCRTHLGRLGVPSAVAERRLNHRVGHIEQVYDQGDYLEERRAALLKWDAFLERMVSPTNSNVTFLAAAKA